MDLIEKLDRAFGLKVVFEEEVPPIAPGAAVATAPAPAPAAPPAAKSPTAQFYGVYDQTGKRLKGGFTSEAEAAAYVKSNPIGKKTGQPLIADPANVKIAPYANEKTLDVLKSLRRPMDHGWSTDEIVAAMKPYIYKFVNMYPSSKDEKEDLAQQGAMGVLHAIAKDKGIADFASHAARYIKGSIDRYVNKGGVVGGSEVAGGGGLGQKGGNTGYIVLWRSSPEEEVQSKIFPADPSAFRAHFSKTGRAPARSLDPGFQKAVAFANELKAAGNVVAVKDHRGGMGSLDKPLGGEAGREPTLGGALPARGTRTPLKIAMDKEQLAQVMAAADLTPQQRKVTELTFGLDVPSSGASGEAGEWGSPEARVAGRMGPPESGEETRQPGTQSGKTPEEMGINPQQAIQNPEFETEAGKTEIARGPVDIARMLGISTEKVRQHRARALQKLQAAADKLGFLQLRRETETGEESTAESFRHIERVCARLLCEMIFSGEINDVILG